MVHKAFHRSLTAGVTLASVGAIALVPIPRQSDYEVRVDARRVITTEIQPAALANHVQLLIDGAVASLQESVHALTTTSPALLEQAMANWPIAETEQAYSQIANAVVAPLMPLVAGPFTEAVTEVLARSAPALREQIETIPLLAEHVTVRLLGPVLAAIGGAGAAHSDIYWATATGDVPGFVTGVLNVPRYMAEGFLFGGYGDVGPLLSDSDGRVVPAPGLFTPWNSDLDLRVQNEAEIAEVEKTGKAEKIAVVEKTAEEVSDSTWRWGGTRDLSEPAGEDVTDSDRTVVDAVEAETGTAATADADDADTDGAGVPGEAPREAKVEKTAPERPADSTA